MTRTMAATMVSAAAVSRSMLGGIFQTERFFRVWTVGRCPDTSHPLLSLFYALALIYVR